MGPKGLPAWHRLMPTAAATTRSVDRKMESPMPDSGPMRAADVVGMLSADLAAGDLLLHGHRERPPTNG